MIYLISVVTLRRTLFVLKAFPIFDQKCRKWGRNGSTTHCWHARIKRYLTIHCHMFASTKGGRSLQWRTFWKRLLLLRLRLSAVEWNVAFVRRDCFVCGKLHNASAMDCITQEKVKPGPIKSSISGVSLITATRSATTRKVEFHNESFAAEL